MLDYFIYPVSLQYSTYYDPQGTSTVYRRASIFIKNRGSETINYTVSHNLGENSPWLQIKSPLFDSCQINQWKTIDLVFIPALLELSTYTTTITISFQNGGTTTIPVSFTTQDHFFIESQTNGIVIPLLKNQTDLIQTIRFQNYLTSHAMKVTSYPSFIDISTSETIIFQESIKDIIFNINVPTMPGIYSDVIKFEARYINVWYPLTNIPIMLDVSETEITVSAGPDLTMAAGQLTRNGDVDPPFNSNIMTAQWTGVGHDLVNLGKGASLVVNIPEPESDYKDYTFEFSIDCNSCSPTHAIDRFTARIAKVLLNSVTIQPAEVSIDLDSLLSHAINLSAIVLPESLNITRYRWTEEPTNPASVLSGINYNTETITISNWLTAGQYQINVTVETPGGEGIASSIIQVTGTGSGVPVLSSLPGFPDEDDIYNVKFFIADMDNEELIEPPTEGGLSVFQDLSIPSIDLSAYEIPLPCANPSICVAHNNKLTVPNEQYIYIAYQAFYLWKWQIYLRQIRLSDKLASLPQYDYPYNQAGWSTDTEITTYDSGQSSVSVDPSSSKIYYSTQEIIYQSNYDATGIVAVYTYTDSDPSTTKDIDHIEIDQQSNPKMVYFGRNAHKDESSTANLMRAQLSNISGTLETIATISQSNANAQIGDIAISQDYIWWFDSSTTTIKRKNKNLSGDTITIATSTLYDDIAVDYSSNQLFIRRQSDNIVVKIDPATNEEETVLTVPFTMDINAALEVDSTDDKVYISDSTVGIIARFNYGGKGYEKRVSSSIVFLINLIDGDNNLFYWTSYESGVYKLKVTPRYFGTFLSFIYIPIDFYTISDPTLDNVVTRVVYELQTTDQSYKLTGFNEYGYYRDIHFTVTYNGDLSSYWYNKNILEFTDVFPDETGSNLSNYPFELSSNPPYLNNAMIREFNTDEVRMVKNDGSISFISNQFGACGAEVADPVLVASSSGHCTRPKIYCNYNNDIIISYEDTGTGKQQIKLKGTGDFCQNSPIGPKGSYLSRFLTTDDFRFYHDITTQQGGINQLADLVVDKNNVTHVTWQSNRDNYWEIYYANSTNSFDAVRITSSKSRSLSPSIDINDNGKIYVAFHDDRFNSYEIFTGYKDSIRVTPLLQQNEYLGSLKNDYDHYMDILPVPVTNSSSTSMYIHVVVKFYDNRLLTNDPIVVVSTQNNPDLFQFADETAAHYDHIRGLFVTAGATEYLSFLGSTSSLEFQENHTYFIKLQYVYEDGTIVDDYATYLSYSCTRCNPLVEGRWISSGSGFSDTRVTFSTHNSFRPMAKTKSSGKLLVLWEDYRFNESESKLLGSLFDSSASPNKLKSSGGNWFDYNYNIVGKDCSITTDLFDRIIMAYEISKEAGTSHQLPLSAIGYKVCDFTETEISSPEEPVPICDYSHLVSNILTDDPHIASQYIKQLNIFEDDVAYYTRNASGESIPVVSQCAVRIEMLGTPEVIAYRIKNESQTSYSDWIPFKPEISNYYTQINHMLSSNAGIKEICVEVATYSGVTTAFSLTAVADYDPIPFDIVFTTTIENVPILLPVYNNTPIAATRNLDSIEVGIWIKVPDEYAVGLKNNPTFDFLQQGIGDIFGVSTEKINIDEPSPGSPPSSESELAASQLGSGDVYYKSITVYTQDERYNKDGLARIKPRFETDCISEFYSTEAAIGTRDIFNNFGKSLVIDQRSDNLASLRDPSTGRIGIRPDSRDEKISGIFSNWLSIRFDDVNANYDTSESGPYILVHHISSLPIWRVSGYSISFWIRAHAEENGMILSETGNANFGFITKSNGKLDVLLGDQRIGSTMIVCNQQWHNVVWIEDNGTAALYVDGERDETNFNHSPSSSFSSNSQTTIGSVLIGSSYMNCFRGYIDELAAWNYKLTPDEIIEVYNDGCPGELPQQNLLILWNRMGDSLGMKETEITLLDESGNGNYSTLHNSLTRSNNIVRVVPCGLLLGLKSSSFLAQP